MKQLHKIMSQAGLEVARIQSLSQAEERPGVIPEIVNVKDCSGLWDIVILQVVIKASSRCSK